MTAVMREDERVTPLELFFDLTAIVARRRLAKAAEGRERNGIARDSYSYLHFPMVAGIALIAVGDGKRCAGTAAPLRPVRCSEG